MNNKFDKLICDGRIYDREIVLKEIENWLTENVLLHYNTVRVPHNVVKPNLFEMFGTEIHSPLEYKELGLNGTHFISNIILECGRSAGKAQAEFEYKPLLREKEERIKELEEQVKQLASVKKTKDIK